MTAEAVSLTTDDAPVDWLAWHREYDDPSSRLSRRLRVVREQLQHALERYPEPVRVVSMCAGEGRDVIGVLREQAPRRRVRARLIELDPRLAAAAQREASAAGLDDVEVMCADASLTDSYADAVPADIVLACGVFGNVATDRITQTLEHLPQLCASAATVIWTRGGSPEHDVALVIRRWLNDHGYEELAYVSPERETFRVGAHRYTGEPQRLQPGLRLFEFVR